MQCAKQGYWHSEYQEFKKYIVDSKANNNYKQFAKNQFHKARRRYDKKIIDRQINNLAEEDHLLNKIFKTNIKRFTHV